MERDKASECRGLLLYKGLLALSQKGRLGLFVLCVTGRKFGHKGVLWSRVTNCANYAKAQVAHKYSRPRLVRIRKVRNITFLIHDCGRLNGMKAKQLAFYNKTLKLEA